MKLEQRDLFTERMTKPYGGRAPYQKHSKTSRQAAHELTVVKLNKTQERILTFIKRKGIHGVTANEVWRRFEYSQNTINPRMVELKEMGLIVEKRENGETVTRLTSYKRPAVVYVAKEFEGGF